MCIHQGKHAFFGLMIRVTALQVSDQENIHYCPNLPIWSFCETCYCDLLLPLLSTWQKGLPSMASTLNILRPRQNGRRFADDTFKRIFVNGNVRISIKISLQFVPKGPINNNPALVQIMAWRRSADKPLSEPVMVSLLTHICVTRPKWVNPGETPFWIMNASFPWTFISSDVTIFAGWNGRMACAWDIASYFLSLSWEIKTPTTQNSAGFRLPYLNVMAWATFSKRNFEIHFLKQKIVYFDLIFIKMCS